MMRRCLTFSCAALLLLALLIITTAVPGSATQLTFDVHDPREKQCFYKEIRKGAEFLLEYQLLEVGHGDVDVVLKDPNGWIVIDEPTGRAHSHTFRAGKTGVYELCFANSSPASSPKTVHLEWHVAESTADHGAHVKSDGVGHLNIGEMRDRLAIAERHLKQQRLFAMKERRQAELMKSRTFFWCLMQAALLLFGLVVQVLVVKTYLMPRHDYII